MFAISNSPESRYDEIMIMTSKMILRIDNNKYVHNVGRHQVIFDIMMIAMACNRRV